MYIYVYIHAATHCNALQHTATPCIILGGAANLRREVALQHLHHAATGCNRLQHAAAHCNTLQHTATHCYTLGGAADSRRGAALQFEKVAILTIFAGLCGTIFFSESSSKRWRVGSFGGRTESSRTIPETVSTISKMPPSSRVVLLACQKIPGSFRRDPHSTQRDPNYIQRDPKCIKKRPELHQQRPELCKMRPELYQRDPNSVR